MGIISAETGANEIPSHLTEEFIDYLLRRVEVLKSENRRLKEENDEIREQSNKNTVGNDNHNSSFSTPIAPARKPPYPHPHLRTFASTSDSGSENENRQDIVAKRVLQASQDVARAKLIAPGMRPDLDIHKLGRKLVQKVKGDKLEEVKDMLDADKSLLSMRSCATGNTLLHIAAAAGAKAVVTYLLGLDEVDPLATDVYGRTALHSAAENLQADICSLFVNKIQNAVGEDAPQDIVGLTPAGCSAMKKANREDEKNKRKLCTDLLHKPGDSCISPMVSRSASRIRKQKQSRRKSNLYQATLSQLNRLSLESDSNTNLQFTYGQASIPGFRVAMEDAICIVPDVKIGTTDNNSKEVSIFGVFDGHGGTGAAQFCADNLERIFCSQNTVKTGEILTDKAALKESLISTCWSLEEEMSKLDQFVLREIVIREAMGDEPRQVEYKAQDNSGTTAVILVMCDSFYAVANIGDSRAILSVTVNGVAKAIPLSRDHKPIVFITDEMDELDAKQFFELEKKRIEKAGGTITEGGYALWNVDKPKEQLAMTRSLGDFQFKQAKDIPKHEQGITAEPEVVIREFSKDDKYIFLACDGIWDVMDNNKVVQFINKNIKQPTNTSEESLDVLCHSLLLECLRLNSEDNMTAIIVCPNELSLSLDNEQSSPVSVETPMKALNSTSGAHRNAHRELFKEPENEKDDIESLSKEELHDLI